MQAQLERDLKAALLAGDKSKVETLKIIKNALQYEAVSLRIERSKLTEEQIIKVLAREAKKRQEAAELYEKAGEQARAEAEKAEKAIIDSYLPEQLSESEIAAAVKREVGKLENPTPADMGRIIGAVRNRLQGQADGALIARLVKENLSR